MVMGELMVPIKYMFHVFLKVILQWKNATENEFSW